ncbi:MAG: pyridoxamine 5'-phosphate oxidase family protein [Lachnospiraceae bacterium]|nr:pyridoxamine 5'-phosphate oxidase family protein [Lachnospiraceae bacterium]
MSANIADEIKKAIESEESVKILGTISKEGIPHVTVKSSVKVTEDGRLTFFELLEKSQTQKNMVYALWFNKTVSINVITKEKKSYQLKGIPKKAVTSGKEFQKQYIKIQEAAGRDVDLSTIWYIDIEEIVEETFSVRRDKLETQYPYELHIDRLAKEEYV